MYLIELGWNKIHTKQSVILFWKCPLTDRFSSSPYPSTLLSSPTPFLPFSLPPPSHFFSPSPSSSHPLLLPLSFFLCYYLLKKLCCLSGKDWFKTFVFAEMFKMQILLRDLYKQFTFVGCCTYSRFGLHLTDKLHSYGGLSKDTFVTGIRGFYIGLNFQISYTNAQKTNYCYHKEQNLTSSSPSNLISIRPIATWFHLTLTSPQTWPENVHGYLW